MNRCQEACQLPREKEPTLAIQPLRRVTDKLSDDTARESVRESTRMYAAQSPGPANEAEHALAQTTITIASRWDTSYRHQRHLSTAMQRLLSPV